TSGPRTNWQWPSTRAMASSMAVPSRRRCAATSMNGIGAASTRACWVIADSARSIGAASAGDPARPGKPRRGAAMRLALQAADRDFERGNALLAGNRGLAAVADRADKSLQLGAQRLGMIDGQMPHRIAAVGLKAEAFGDLPSEQVA